MKAYTDLEQSKKLAEILPLESADMYYAGHQSIINPKEWEYGDTPKIRGKYISFDDKRIFYPCWSLAALLELIPNYVINKADDKIYANLYYGLKSSHDNLVDAAFEMIKELHELKML